MSYMLALVSIQKINFLPNEKEKLSRSSMILVGHGFGGTIIKNVSGKFVVPDNDFH